MLSRTQVQRNQLRALAAPHPGRPPGWLTRASSPAGSGVASHRPPRGLPHGAPGASTASAAVGRGVAPGAPCGRAAPGRRDATQLPACKICDRCGEAGRETPDRESDVWRPADTAGQSPRPKSLPIYISWYINGYGRPWTSLDVNPRIRPVHGQIAGTGGGLLATTDHMAGRHVPWAGGVHAMAWTPPFETAWASCCSRPQDRSTAVHG